MTTTFRRTGRCALALGLLLSGGIAHASTILKIYGDPSDSMVHKPGFVGDTGIFGSDPGGSQGEVGVNGGFDYSDVFVFQLPTLASGQQLLAASFSYYDLASGSNFPTDLYGLHYRSSPTVLASDWYSGPLDPNATMLQQGFVPPSFSNVGRLGTNTLGSNNLLNYINAQYAGGAVGGDYIFLRLSADQANEPNLNVNFSYHADAAIFYANHYGVPLSFFADQYSPILNLSLSDPVINPAVTQAPEPSSAAGIGTGLLAWYLLRRRSRQQARAERIRAAIRKQLETRS